MAEEQNAVLRMSSTLIPMTSRLSGAGAPGELKASEVESTVTWVHLLSGVCIYSTDILVIYSSVSILCCSLALLHHNQRGIFILFYSTTFV